MERRSELKTETAEHSPWELIEGGRMWSLLCDGWVVAEVCESNTGDFFCSKVRADIPAFVHKHLPTKVSRAIILKGRT